MGKIKRKSRPVSHKGTGKYHKRLDDFTLFLILFFVLFTTIIYFLFLQKKPSSKSDFGEINETILAQGYDPLATSGEFENKIVYVPQVKDMISMVLGESAGGKRIAVDLSRQKVLAYDNNQPVMEFTVSTGRWAPTPKGVFTIQRKIRAQKMSGGNRTLGTYYYLPNVPWVMFFGNSQISWARGYSFHGTYWHNNFGVPMSHGCINMRTPEAETLYKWAPEGTSVQIY